MSANELVDHVISGFAGGIGLCLVGHPLDTIKGRMQQGRPPLQGSLYKGMSIPLITSGFLNMALFTITASCRKLVHPDESTPISIREVIYASWLTSPIYVLAVTPVEMIKVNLQVGSASGPLQVVNEIGVTGLWRGYFPTVGMRLVGLPAYFGAYEGMKRYFGYPQKELGNMEIIHCGGIAGFFFWLVNFPLDTIKTRMQSSAQPIGLQKAVRQIGSVRALYRGLLPCLARSYPANAACFLCFEWSQKQLTQLRSRD